MPDGQRQFEWAADTLKAACARCGLAGIETKLFLCAAAERDPRLGGEETGMLGRPAVMEGESVWRIDGSIRGVAERLGASEKGLRLALGRLEAKGLATSGRDRAGSSIVLCVGRLFADSGGVSDEPEMERPLKLPPPGGADRVRTGCGPGAESVRSGVRSFSESEKGMNIPSENLSLRTESETLRDSAPNSAPNSARVRTAWQDVDDATLESLDRRWLRALFRCAVDHAGWIAEGDAKQFLAAAHHAATDPAIRSTDGRPNPRVRVLQWRVSRRRWRGLRDESWAWAGEQLGRRPVEPVARLAEPIGRMP